MPRILYLYFARRILFAALLLELGFCVPIVMSSLLRYLPPAALGSGLLLAALCGTLPTVIYIALPVAVGMAVALEFSRMASDGMFAVLYSLRLSIISICLPGGIVGFAAVCFGYWISCFVGPAYVGQMHDVIYVIQNSLNHHLLEPAQFYTLDNGARTLYFQRWESPDVASNMYIHQFNDKNEEETITAQQAEFRRNKHGVLLIMKKGSFQSRPVGSTRMRTGDFNEYVIGLDMQGTNGMPKRNWRGVFELSLRKFLDAAPGRKDSHFFSPSDWMSEAAKRFGVPILALSHSMLAMGLVLSLASKTGRAATTIAALVTIPVVHIGILMGNEALVLRDPRLIVVVAAAIALEFIVALLLITCQQRTSRRWSAGLSAVLRDELSRGLPDGPHVQRFDGPQMVDALPWSAFGFRADNLPNVRHRE